jgi:YtxC-like family.
LLQLTVSEKGTGSGLLARLQREVRFLRGLGLDAHLQSFESGSRRFYLCCVSPAASGSGKGIEVDVAEVARASIAIAVKETVLEDWEPRLLTRMIARIRPGYRREDKARVHQVARAIAQRVGEDAFSERSRVLQRTLDYLSEADFLQLDGFVRFRLKAYREELMDCVRQAVDDLEVEKEREELIALLKEFIQGRSSEVPVVHILPAGEERFRLVDQGGAPVEAELFNDFQWDLVDADQVDMEELLITALVSIAPRRVVCHRPIETGDIPMVADVFAGKLITCAGCELCRGPAVPGTEPPSP